MCKQHALRIAWTIARSIAFLDFRVLRWKFTYDWKCVNTTYRVPLFCPLPASRKGLRLTLRSALFGEGGRDWRPWYWNLKRVGYRPQMKWAATCDFQYCGILTSGDSDEPVQPLFRLRNSKWCSAHVSSLTAIEYLSDWQRLWLDSACAQADLRLCWSHIPHCWESHVAIQ